MVSSKKDPASDTNEADSEILCSDQELEFPLKVLPG